MLDFPTMASLRSRPLEAGQTTIIATLNKGLSVRPIRPGPRPTPSSNSSSNAPQNDRRRIVGGPNKRAILQLFSDFRRANGEEEEEEEDNDLGEDSDRESIKDLISRRRYSYTREHKLAAIEYLQTTWMKRSDGTLVRISLRRAARKLKITRKMLRTWVKDNQKILNQKKGSRRAREPWEKGQEDQMEIELNKLFQEARAEGRKIGQKWILRHAKEIYRTVHPERAIQGQDSRWKYTGFKFSQGWFQGFQRRFRISLRCGTKRAQKTPEQLRETIQSWLQFNRCNTVVLPTLDCGKLRDDTVSTIGRYKLSEIANID